MLPDDDAPRVDDDVFRRLVESVRDYAIFMLNPQGRIASWNSGAELIKQYSAAEAVGQHFSIFYEPAAIASGWPQEELRCALRDGRFEDEGWRLRKDGSRFWANVVIAPLFDDAGHLLGYSKVTRDLSERRAHEERLRRSERSLRLLIESVQDYAIFMLDAQGVIASWNPGAQRIKGYAAAEVIGRPFSIFYTAEAVARRWPEEELSRARSAGRFEDEGWRVRKDGTLIWANVVITAVRDETGELIGFSKVTRDLTERRRHESQLRDSEERLRLIVDGVKDHAMFLLDAEGQVVSWNSAAQRVLGYASADVVGRDASVLYPADERDAGKPQAEMAAVAHAGFFHAEGWKVRADGSRLWADTSITSIRGADGALKGFVHIVRDLTEQRRIEELEAEGRRVLEFIAMLSHELRNPLAPIRTAVSILKMPQGQQQTGRYADMIGRQVTQLTRLVDDLMDVSRITTGKIELELATLEINTLVQVAVDSMRNTLETLDHTLDLTLAPQAVFIDGDSVRLTQVVVNLLSNAAKFTAPKGRIEIAVRRDHTVVRIEVSDNGIGMSQSLMERAFDPFVQGERSLARSEGGLGIGLTLVKKIVDLHAGSVVAASAGAGLGTKFTVTLPITKDERLGLAAVARASSPGTGTILVVDDNRDAAEAMAELLQASGRHVLVAFDGQQALDIAARRPISAVLLDIGLPDMSGYEVAKRLRRLPASRDTRIIATTGYGLTSDREASAEAGFNAHLVKPVDHEEVLRLIA
jgi:PAS domain S-box-containing protein